eukprot:1159547-Amorphochlora_amoeboformis.AAC.1
MDRTRSSARPGWKVDSGRPQKNRKLTQAGLINGLKFHYFHDHSVKSFLASSVSARAVLQALELVLRTPVTAKD